MDQSHVMKDAAGGPESSGASGPSPAKRPLLSIEHVAISYRMPKTTVQAVGDVSFEMADRERLILIGPSGCGKSTLLKAVAGFVTPDSGTITFDGHTNLVPAPDRAVVFQEFDQLFPWRTVRDNVAYPLRITGRGKAEALAEANRFLDLMALSDAADRYPHQLSGGMKQRVAIARAMALNPRMLLMDEPFGSLDAITRARLQRELKSIADRTNVTIFFVTHSIQEALVLADRIVVLSSPPSRVLEVVEVKGLGGPIDPRYGSLQQHLQTLLGATKDDHWEDHDGIGLVTD
jgi:NitT/TauT family transport system ATP-binding protein